MAIADNQAGNMSKEPLVLDSVTHLTEQHRGAAAHCASHGGVYAGYFAAFLISDVLILSDGGPTDLAHNSEFWSENRG